MSSSFVSKISTYTQSIYIHCYVFNSNRLLKTTQQKKVIFEKDLLFYNLE